MHNIIDDLKNHKSKEYADSKERVKEKQSSRSESKSKGDKKKSKHNESHKPRDRSRSPVENRRKKYHDLDKEPDCFDIHADGSMLSIVILIPYQTNLHRKM